jgi:hypothetical protein
MRRFKVVVSGLVIAGLTGCQSTPSPRALWHSMTVRVAPQPLSMDAHAVSIRCSGGVACAFERLDEQPLLTDSGQINAVARQAHLLQAEQASEQSGGMVLYPSAGVHQLRLQFYPVTKTRAENFVLIHDFKAGQDYRLHLFRQRQDHVASLLATATPDPLCVELLEGEQQVRLFCRPFDPETGLGEFVETRVSKK